MSAFDVIDMTEILSRLREKRLADELEAANKAITYMAEICRKARKDCMHPKSVQAQLLDAAIARAESFKR